MSSARIIPVTLQVEISRAFLPLLPDFMPDGTPVRYKAAHGGRGSGKSHFFAEHMIEKHRNEPGSLSVCIREVQKTLAQSSKRLLEMKMAQLRVGPSFKPFHDCIKTPGDGLIIFQGMQDHTAESIKSLEGYNRAWIEEAQTLSERSLELLRPTIRAPGSQIWASWNPRRKRDAIDHFFRTEHLDDAVVVQANWRDNHRIPPELLKERETDLRIFPERVDHVWEGGYVQILSGAYFAASLNAAKGHGRIGKISPDPLLPIRAFFDLGGSGASADAMAIWIAQWVGREVRVLDYIEGQGQVLAYYVQLLRDRGWGRAICYLPHDGVNENNISGKRYEDHVREAGFDVVVIKNQGRGAAMMRVESTRRLFPQIYFNAETTEAGRDALGYYHERRDETRNVGLGPEHDWASHGADAFGLMCVAYEEPRVAREKRNTHHHPTGGWMG